jgi:uncharacterized membrane protein HdeD (DUF308 family)
MTTALPRNVLDDVHRHGWPFLLWGIVVALFGVAVLAWPQLTGKALVTLIGLVMLGVGLVAVYGAVRLRELGSGIWLIALVPALVVAAVGLVVLFAPEAVSKVVLVVVAVIALLAGIWDLVSGISLLSAVRWGWLRTLRGALLVLFGVWVILTPISGLAALGWVVGVLALALAGISIALGILALRV